MEREKRSVRGKKGEGEKGEKGKGGVGRRGKGEKSPAGKKTSEGKNKKTTQIIVRFLVLSFVVLLASPSLHLETICGSSLI